MYSREREGWDEDRVEGKKGNPKWDDGGVHEVSPQPWQMRNAGSLTGGFLFSRECDCYFLHDAFLFFSFLFWVFLYFIVNCSLPACSLFPLHILILGGSHSILAQKNFKPKIQ